ncbi:MAG: NINE protein [Planctomycetes bacterium]|nr:NINE protein [Planctomycetota bacterium]
MLRAGQLDRDDLAWVEGTPDWVPLSTVPGVFAVSAPRRRSAASDVTILPAFLLAFFLGPLGIHRFYAGRTGSGVAMLVLTLTVVGVIITGIWATVDCIILACGAFRAGDGKLMKEWT